MEDEPVLASDCCIRRPGVMPGLIGQLPDFWMGNEFNVYKERLDEFFEANDIPESKRNAILINSIGNDAYKILKEICGATLPKNKPYEELCELLEVRFKPATFKDRVGFYTAKQNEGESIRHWYNRLKDMVKEAKFDNCYNGYEALMLDIFVTGMRPGKIQDALLQKSTNTPIAEIYDLALTMEEDG